MLRLISIRFQSEHFPLVNKHISNEKPCYKASINSVLSSYLIVQLIPYPSGWLPTMHLPSKNHRKGIFALEHHLNFCRLFVWNNDFV